MPESPQTDVDICNLALDHVSELPIEDLAGDGRNENLCARWYDQSRRALLRRYLWNWAQKFTPLGRHGDGAGRYADAYLLPADCLRVAYVGQSYDLWTRITDYEMTSDATGKLIHCDNSGGALYVKYVVDITNVGMMDPLFIDLLALRIAMRIAWPITQKKSVVESISALFTDALQDATGIDGQENPPTRIQRSKYLAARRGWGYGNAVDTSKVWFGP